MKKEKTAASSEVEQFVDLLIFEESFRQEYLKLKSIKRKYTRMLQPMSAGTLSTNATLVLFGCLLAWNIYFLLGVWQGSPQHHYLSFIHRVCCLIGLSTLLLFYLSGLYHDTLIQPRKFVPQANRALRHYNVKLVVMNRGWLRMFRNPLPGEGLRLVVSSKAGTMQFREAFEQYREEYWSEVRKNATNAKHKKKDNVQHAAHDNHRHHQHLAKKQ